LKKTAFRKICVNGTVGDAKKPTCAYLSQKP
jgi:hypothetical protein